MKRKPDKDGVTPAARHFDSLPDSALVDVRTVAIVRGVCDKTIWRHVRLGLFPKPEPKIPGTHATRWQVGKVRAAGKVHETPKP